LAAIVLVPFLLLLAIEAVLRLAGYGYPTAFLLPDRIEATDVFRSNNRFGWRFFGPNLAREPAALSLARPKPADTVRIFVFGESAAFGDPAPDYGLPRMLQALLSLRYPGARFEVINAAMTGINSHAVLPIARDCAAASPDLFVVYMGNNEVVGPFGPGTVFTSQTPSLGYVRLRLALQSTRFGQLLEAAYRRFRPSPSLPDEWGGLAMFLEHRIRSDDPRLHAVYRHFEHNLRAIIKTGQRAGAGVVVSTVAVNLRDCPPFASLSRPELSAADQDRWRALRNDAEAARKSGQPADAIARLREAAALDDTPAELHFRWGQCALAIGETDEARRHLRQARDLDALRFRCDSRLNEITRQAASGREREGIRLADADEAFARASPDGLPGEALFYEHVHLTFEGNHLLARALAEQIEPLLPPEVRQRAPAGQPWPSVADCALRLAWTDASRFATGLDLLSRFHDPPFNQQLDHRERVQRLTRQLESVAASTNPAARRRTLDLTHKAVTASPQDPVLLQQLAGLLQQSGDLAAAADAARRAVALLPHHTESWNLLGQILAQQDRNQEAQDAFEQVLRADPRSYQAHHHLGNILLRTGRAQDALAHYQRAIAIQPRLGLAYLGLGHALSSLDRKPEANAAYRQALAHRINRAPELALLARFCHAKGWFLEARTAYLDALRLNPVDPALHLEAGRCLATLGQREEAARLFAEAVRLAPDSMEARFLLGTELGRLGRPLEAAEQFRETLRLRPDLLEARLNLGVAWEQAGRLADALAEFQAVLERNPTNRVALEHLRALRTNDTPLP